MSRKLPPEPLTKAEVDRLLDVISKRAVTGIRNAALIILLYRSMLRVTEALSLYPRDLNPSDGSIRVRHGKGDKYRVVGLDSRSWPVLLRWIDKRRELGITDHKPLLCTLDGGPVIPSYVRGMFTRLGKRAGITKRVHAHGLRHTGACELAAEGVDIRVISRQLGHSNVATTHRYLDHLSNQDVVAAIYGRVAISPVLVAEPMMIS